MERRVFFLTCILNFKSFVLCANILIANNLASFSHQIWNDVIAEGLIARGHNITMLGPQVTLSKAIKTYHPILLEEVIIEDTEEMQPENLVGKSNLDMLLLFDHFKKMICQMSYKSKGLTTLIDYPKDFKFDLILFDLTAGGCLLPLIQRFHYPPALAITAYLLPSYISRIFGNTLEPSYVPLHMTTYSDEMNFFQRIENYILDKLESILGHLDVEPELDKLAREHFGRDIDSIAKLERHLSLLLCNYSPVLQYPQPVTPNIIPIGGVHIRPAKKLPQDLEQIMDNAKHGVILFALGTNLKSDQLRPEKRQAFLDTFGKLKQTVIWKFESDLPNLPKNVIIRKWLPQADIMAHPNLKLFISHGGALSTMEAVYYGVPVIGIPFFSDQRLNVEKLTNKKIALKVDYMKLTSKLLLDSIYEILTNPLYSKNMKIISSRMKDQPQAPLETAIFWIEYSIRHNGSQILSPKSRDLSAFVSSSKDVELFLVSVLCIVIISLYKIIKIVISICCTKEKLKTN